MFYSELTWVLLYVFTSIEGIINDDLILISTTIFILGFAGLEYATGILMLLLFKHINKKIEFNETDNEFYNYNIYSKKNLYMNRFI